MKTKTPKNPPVRFYETHKKYWEKAKKYEIIKYTCTYTFPESDKTFHSSYIYF